MKEYLWVALAFLMNLALFPLEAKTNKEGSRPVAKGLILDMDGVLRCGHNKVEGAAEFLDWATRSHIPGLILSNVDRYSEDMLRAELDEMGLSLPPKWGIYTAGHAFRDFFLDYVKDKGGVKLLVIGEDGLKNLLREKEGELYTLADELQEGEPSGKAFVVIGCLQRVVTEDLEKAQTWINRGARTFITCPDRMDAGTRSPVLGGLPDNVVHILSQVAPTVPYNTGKPNPLIMKRSIEILQEQDPSLRHEEILFVGDTIETDIQQAFEARMPSALVLTGNTTEAMLEKSVIQPDFVFDDILAIKDFLGEESVY